MIRFLLNQGWGHYLALCFIWAACYWLPVWAITHTEFYGEWFHPLQAIVPLLLIFAVFNLTSQWWRKELAMVLILQIFLNLADVILDADWKDYDRNQGILNILELIILVGGGLSTLIISTYQAHRKERADKPADSRADTRHRMAKGPEGISGV